VRGARQSAVLIAYKDKKQIAAQKRLAMTGAKADRRATEARDDDFTRTPN